MRNLVFLILAFIVYGSLYPWRFDFSRDVGPVEVLLHSWPALWNRGAVRDAVENVLLYIPLGAAAVLAGSGRRARWRTIAAAVAGGFALSTFVEVMQVWIPWRDPSLSDIVFNTAGCAAGAVAAAALRPWWNALAARRDAGRSAALLLLGCWTAAQLFPFLPTLSPSRVGRGLLVLLRARPISAIDIWTAGAEWLAACAALQALTGSRHARWAPVVVGLLALRAFTPARPMRAEEIFGAAGAALLWLVLGESMRPRMALAMLISAVALRELAPFHFTAAVVAPFSWIPFRASFEADPQPAVIVVLRKAFDYGALVWLLARSGLGYKRAATLSALGLFLCELAQRHLPGRTPEITDSILAALMAAALSLAETL